MFPGAIAITKISFQSTNATTDAFRM